VQKCYLSGLAAEGLLVFGPTEADEQEQFREMPGGGPQVRKAAAGADVIDLKAMAEELKRAQ
jgi:hypothetical protein